jgi:hypothetical protein
MSSRLSTLTNTIHIRDFVDAVVDDPTRSDSSYIEIQADVYIFPENGFRSANVIAESIPTRIRAYVTPAERELYVHNTFFFAEGRFATAVTSDGKLEIIVVHTLSLMRYVISNLSHPSTPSLTLDRLLLDTQVTPPTFTSIATIYPKHGARS